MDNNMHQKVIVVVMVWYLGIGINCRFLASESAITALYQPFHLIISAISVSSHSYWVVLAISGIKIGIGKNSNLICSISQDLAKHKHGTSQDYIKLHIPFNSMQKHRAHIQVI